jgi:hypothetical protein
MVPAVARADEPKPAPAPAVGEASAEEIKRLIKDLGDDSFEVRERATRRLVEIGKPALPAVKEAQTSKDAEVRSRADKIVDRLDPKPKTPAKNSDPVAPQIAPGGIRIIGPGNVQIKVQAVGGVGGAVVKEIQVQEDGKKVHITENAEGIKVVVTEKDPNGKEATREFKAKTAEDLKKNHPEAYELYIKHSGGVQLNIAPGVLRPVPAQPLRPGLRNNPQLEEQKKRMEQLLKQLGPQGEKAAAQLKELEELQKKLFDNNGNVNDLEKLLDELFKAAGGGVAVPGVPAEDGRPRLGVEVQPVDDTLRNQLGIDHGVVVRRVLPGSRAEKLGLREHDILQKAGGRKIEGIEDLRRAVEENKKLALEGVRGGKPQKWEEKE